MKRYKIILGAAGFLFILGLVGTEDLKEEEQQAQLYNEMVCKGLWGDYENRKPNCKQWNQ